MFPTEAGIFMLERQHYDYCFAEICFHGPNCLKGQGNAVSDEVEKFKQKLYAKTDRNEQSLR